MSLTNEAFLQRISGRPLTALEPYKGSKTKIRFRCDIDGHIWSAAPNTISQGHGCPKCGIRKCAKGLGHDFLGNRILEDHGDWLLIDISTPSFPDSSMAIDSDVWARRSKYRIGAIKGAASKYIYAQYSSAGRSAITSLMVHRHALPKRDGFEVDHIKHGSMSFVDNRRLNLRYATSSQNEMNKGLRRHNISGTTGVSMIKRTGRWKAEITVEGRRIHLGYFSKSDAIEARKQAEQKYFGDFAFGGVSS